MTTTPVRRMSESAGTNMASVNMNTPINSTNNIEIVLGQGLKALQAKLQTHNLPTHKEFCRSAYASMNLPPPSEMAAAAAAADSSTKSPESVTSAHIGIGRSPIKNLAENHTRRFGKSAINGRSTTARSTWFGNSEAPDYENIVDDAILSAPITDIRLLMSSDPVPPGFYRLSRSLEHRRANLNEQSGGNPLYLAIRKDPSAIPITNLVLVIQSNDEVLPLGYEFVNRDNQPANLNATTGHDPLFLCYRRDETGMPITDIQLVFTGRGEICPADFYLLHRSVSGASANINPGGIEAMISYKQNLQRISNLLGVLCTESRLKRFNTAKNQSFFTQSPSDDMFVSRCASQIDPLLESLHGESEMGVDLPMNASAPNSASNLQDANDPYLSDAYGDDSSHGGDVANGDDISRLQSTNLRSTELPVSWARAMLVLLSSFYVRHDEELACLSAANLYMLIDNTTLFAGDLASLHQPGILSLLSLTIEIICERCEAISAPNHHNYLKFLTTVARRAGPQLSYLLLSKIYRAISYFATLSSTKRAWMLKNCSTPFSEAFSSSPFRVLEELINSNAVGAELLVNAQKAEDSQAMHMLLNEDECFENESISVVSDFLDDFIDDVLTFVDVSHLTRPVLLTLSKASNHPASSGFWRKCNHFSKGFFTEQPLKNSFMILCALCKQAWMEMTKLSNGDYRPRELGMKLIALEALEGFCMSADEAMYESRTMGCVIRRTIVPCLLFNANYALSHPRILEKVLKVITALWKKWRKHIHVEFALLCDRIVFKILQASSIQLAPEMQMIAVQEMINWFDIPQMLIEMFVNYDMDNLFVSQWNTFSYLVRTMCSLSRRLPDLERIEIHSRPQQTVSERDVYVEALEKVKRLAKLLMDTTGHAFLMVHGQDEKFVEMSLISGAGWTNDEDEGGDEEDDEQSVVSMGTVQPDRVTRRESMLLKTKRATQIRFQRDNQKQSETLIEEAKEIFNKKGSLKPVVRFLITRGFIPNTPQEVVNFLRVYKSSFDPVAIGEYLGEGGKNAEENEFYEQVRLRYTRAVSFAEKDIESSLRLYLTGCGFRMPGEGQKVSRFIEAFAKAFFQDNSGTPHCPFPTEDSVCVVAFGIVMLNTDLHRANADGRRKAKKMTKEEFIVMLREQTSARDYLDRVYENIQSTPIEMLIDITNQQKLSADSNLDSGSSLNTFRPITSEVRAQEEANFLKEFLRGLRDAEDLTASLSINYHHFQMSLTEIHFSVDLVNYLYDSVRQHFHTVVETIFKAGSNVDTNSMCVALEILGNSLASAIFLNLKMEYQALSSVLHQFRLQYEPGYDRNGDQVWTKMIDEVSESTALATVSRLHMVIHQLKDVIQENKNSELTRRVMKELGLKKKHFADKNVFFVRQGQLLKHHNGGSMDRYTFFLFSDFLVYAQKLRLGILNLSTNSSKYNVHMILNLEEMEIMDSESATTRFYINHPMKSFYVEASNPQEKQSWVRDIFSAIHGARSRGNTEHVADMQRRMFIEKPFGGDGNSAANANTSTPTGNSVGPTTSGNGNLYVPSPGTSAAMKMFDEIDLTVECEPSGLSTPVMLSPSNLSDRIVVAENSGEISPLEMTPQLQNEDSPERVAISPLRFDEVLLSVEEERNGMVIEASPVRSSVATSSAVLIETPSVATSEDSFSAKELDGENQSATKLDVVNSDDVSVLLPKA